MKRFQVAQAHLSKKLPLSPTSKDPPSGDESPLKSQYQESEFEIKHLGQGANGGGVSPLSKTNQAKVYDFCYRPHEIQGVRVRKEREYAIKTSKGIVGSPQRSQQRNINKLFDSHR